MKPLTHLKPYEDLTEELKEVARDFKPDDFENWLYHTQGIEILWCAGSP